MLSKSLLVAIPSRLAAHVEVGIAATRLLLWVALLLALVIDATRTAQSSTTTYAVLITYVTASAMVLAWVWLAPERRRVNLLMHVADLLAVLGLAYFAGGASGATLVGSTFVLVSAALRWGMRGTAITSAIALAGLAVAGLAVGSRYDAVGAIVLALHLVVVALLIAHLAWRRDLDRTAVARERESLARELHDGLLQELTAIGLHLEAMARTLPDDQLATTRGLATVIRDHQASIRAFATRTPELRQSDTTSGSPDGGRSR